MIEFSFRTLAVGFVVAGLTFVRRGETQRVRSTATEPCPGCRLLVDSIVTLGVGEKEGEYFAKMVNHVLVTSEREIIVLVQGERSVPVYDFKGRLLRTVGRKGSGPAEFPRAPFRVSEAVNGDLYFFDQRSLGLVFRPNGTYVRSITLGRSADRPVVLSDGRIAASRPWYHRIPEGRVLNEPLILLFDTLGAPIRTIGRGITAADGGLVPGRDGSIWTWTKAPYTMRHWGQDGALLRLIERIVPNFDARPYRNAWEFVQPNVVRLWQARDGLLWVTYLDSPPRKNCASPIELCYSSMIEVLDPVTGALIASKRMAQSVVEIVGDGYLARFVNTDPNGVVVTIFSARLIRSHSPSR